METPTALLALCEGNPPVTGGFPIQRANNANLLCLLCCSLEKPVEHTVKSPMISGAIWQLLFVIAFRKLATFTPHFVEISVLIALVDLVECCCVKTNIIAKSSWPNQILFAWGFEIFRLLIQIISSIELIVFTAIPPQPRLSPITESVF